MTRTQEGDFVVPKLIVRIVVAAGACIVILGPLFGAGVGYVIRDASQEQRIASLEKADDDQDKKNEKRFERIENKIDLILERLTSK